MATPKHAPAAPPEAAPALPSAPPAAPAAPPAPACTIDAHAQIAALAAAILPHCDAVIAKDPHWPGGEIARAIRAALA